jgi:hypothetical protein
MIPAFLILGLCIMCFCLYNRFWCGEKEDSVLWGYICGGVIGSAIFENVTLAIALGILGAYCGWKHDQSQREERLANEDFPDRRPPGSV